MVLKQRSYLDSLKTHIPALDGLRAVAIIWVMLHNGSLDTALNTESIVGKLTLLFLNSGWLGVQIFFVLSGFLITGILLDAKRNQSPLIYRQFYIRRVLRIFPIYYVFLISAFTLAATLPESPDWLHAAYVYKYWHFLYTSNWLAPFEEVGFSHFWSLAIEEQFYIFWPVVIITLSFSRLYTACFLLITTSIVFRLTVTNYDLEFAESAAYVSTFARIDALAVGALLAITLRDKTIILKVHKIIKALLSFSFIYILFTLLTQRGFAAVSPGWTVLNQTVSAIFFAGVLYYCLDINTTDNKDRIYIRILSSAGLRSIGKYSYAMYIFHLPVARLLHTYLSKKLMSLFSFIGASADTLVFIIDLLLLFSITYTLAWCSWRLIERPFLNLKRYFPMDK